MLKKLGSNCLYYKSNNITNSKHALLFTVRLSTFISCINSLNMKSKSVPYPKPKPQCGTMEWHTEQKLQRWQGSQGGTAPWDWGTGHLTPLFCHEMAPGESLLLLHKLASLANWENFIWKVALTLKGVWLLGPGWLVGLDRAGRLHVHHILLLLLPILLLSLEKWN